MKGYIVAMCILLSSISRAQIQKSYIKYFTAGNYRNSEGDVIVKNDGTYYAVWTEFGKSTADDFPAKLSAKVSTDGGKNWTGYTVVQDNIGTKTTMSVSLVRISTSVVHMYFLVKNSNTDLKVYRKISNDDCVSWGAATQIISDAGYNIVLNGKVRKTTSGRFIMPIGWIADANASPGYFRAYCYYSDDNGETWFKSSPELNRTVGTGFPEVGICELSAGTILMSMRESTTGYQWVSSSTDNGSNWTSPAVQSSLESTASPAQLVKLSNGHLIALHNPAIIPDTATYNTRMVLRISRSEDNGGTWTKLFDLEYGPTGNYNFSYPSAVEYNGNLLVQYWETNYQAGKIALKFASIPISNL